MSRYFTQVHVTVARVAGELVRDLADSLFLPFNLFDYAQLLRDLYFSLHINIGSLGAGHGLDLGKWGLLTILATVKLQVEEAKPRSHRAGRAELCRKLL